MKEIERYNIAKTNIENYFRGLPYAHSLLIIHLISRANPYDGVVVGVSYNDLSLLLTINKAPGRKESGTPSKQTIRNYIKSIERECGDHFKIITEGQNLKFYFPDMPKQFHGIGNSTEVNTERSGDISSYHVEKMGVKKDESENHNIDVNTERAGIRGINNINNNKQTRTEISADFYPSRETILLAELRGLEKVTDEEEIKKFIHFNQANKTHWVDFNPVFIRWLEREAEYREQQAEKKEEQEQQQTQNKEQQGTRRIGHAGASNKRKSFAEQRAEVYEKNKDALDPDEPYLPADDAKRELIEATHFLALDTPHRAVYQPLYQQIR